MRTLMQHVLRKIIKNITWSMAMVFSNPIVAMNMLKPHLPLRFI